MGSFADYLENEMIDHIFGNGAYSVPTIYVALSTSDPTDAGVMTGEPSGSSYARVQHSGAAAWSNAVSRSLSNVGTVAFPKATGAWGLITHYAICDALTAGNVLAHGTLNTGKDVVDGNTPSIASGEIVVSFEASTGGSGFTDYLAHKILDHLFGNGSFSPPSLYAALSTTVPTDGGTGLTEPVGNNYARKVHAVWTAANSGQTANSGDITFATPSGSWGMITNSAICDALSGGNMLMFGDVVDQEPTSGDPVKFPSGDLTVTLT